jgi:Transposase
MNKGSKKSAVTTKPIKTVGLDIGDRYSYYCVLNADAELMEEGRIRTTEEALRRHFADSQRRRIALETGTHSPWISRLLQDLGHEVIVANARKLESISASRTKNDRNDAEQLARLAHSDPKLLSPLMPCGATCWNVVSKSVKFVTRRPLEHGTEVSLLGSTQRAETMQVSPISPIPTATAGCYRSGATRRMGAPMAHPWLRQSPSVRLRSRKKNRPRQGRVRLWQRLLARPNEESKRRPLRNGSGGNRG